MKYHKKHTFHLFHIAQTYMKTDIQNAMNRKSTHMNRNRRAYCFSLTRLICVFSSRCRIQSTSNCPTMAFLDSPSMRGLWGWKAHRATRLLRSDQASCMMRKYGPPLLNLHYVMCGVSYTFFPVSSRECCKVGDVALLVHTKHIITLKGSHVQQLGHVMHFSSLILNDSPSLHCVVTLRLLG